MKNFLKNCILFQDDLKAYTDGELSPLRRALVRRHLTHCASCQEEINFMTQLTEDLRTTETEDALSPALREKMLGVPLAPSDGGTGTEPIPSGSPIIGAGGTSFRKRRLPAWTYAALAVVAWFVCYPIYQRNLVLAPVARSSTPVAMGAYRAEPLEKASNSAPAQQAITPPIPNVPSPMPISVSGGGVPLPAMAPPPKPMVSFHVVSAPKVASRAAYAANGTAPLNTIDGNGDTLNGDPDSLRQVHKEASIGLRVPDPDATGDKLNDMVKETGGYVAANNLTTGDDGRKFGELIVKVPEAQFQTFLAATAKLGTVVSKNITGQDITEQTSDAHEAQSVEDSDLQQAEARLKALGSKAKWEDKQDTEDLRVKLAQTRARLKMLKRMAALGTITIDLSQTPKAAAAVPVTGGFLGTLQATTHDALQSLVGSAAALLALVIWLLAYAPIWVPLLLLGRYALKEYRKREAAQ